MSLPFIPGGDFHLDSTVGSDCCISFSLKTMYTPINSAKDNNQPVSS